MQNARTSDARGCPRDLPLAANFFRVRPERFVEDVDSTETQPMKKAGHIRSKLALPESGRGAVFGYIDLLAEISTVINAGRHQAAWSLNAIMSAVYWDIGRRIVQF